MSLEFYLVKLAADVIRIGEASTANNHLHARIDVTNRSFDICNSRAFFSSAARHLLIVFSRPFPAPFGRKAGGFSVASLKHVLCGEKICILSTRQLLHFSKV